MPVNRRGSPAKDLYWYSESQSPSPAGAVIFLPGRGNHGYQMVRRYSEVFDWKDFGLFSVTPKLSVGWYPPPNGPGDQREAVSGLKEAGRDVDRILDLVERTHGIPRSRTVISGFSMGAVTALHWATRTDSPVAAVVCHSGAILQPSSVPFAEHTMPIVLNHALDDYCFGWEERYLPMKLALRKKGYNVLHAEREFGDHVILNEDVRCLKPLFQSIFDHRELDWKPIWAA